MQELMVELTTALPDYPASVVLDRAPPCLKGTHCLQCRMQGGNQGTRRSAEGGFQHRRWAHAMFPTQKQQLQLAVRPPAWSRRQSGLREDNVLKLHCTQFSQCGQPVWEVQPALPPALCWRRSSSLPLPRLMWLWRQREGRGLILLFILNRLSTSLTVPFEQDKKKKKRVEADFKVYLRAFEERTLRQVWPHAAKDTVTHTTQPTGRSLSWRLTFQLLFQMFDYFMIYHLIYCFYNTTALFGYLWLYYIILAPFDIWYGHAINE